jgi:uncharacterized protein (TIGR02246 family)
LIDGGITLQLDENWEWRLLNCILQPVTLSLKISSPAKREGLMRCLFILSGVVCLAFMLLPACAPRPEQQAEPVAEEAPSTEADVEAIKAVNEQCLAAINSGDLDTIVSLFTDDGVYMLPNEPPVIGKAPIKSRLQMDLDNFNFTETWSSEEIVVFGDWAFDRGTSKVTITPKQGGQPVEDVGKYIWILKRQSDGSWKYARAMWLRITPT